ncbi:metal-dependent hydrolase [Chengkuizengella axinellae]|uniref:Metal-dependent hydrolase n=1 Tax=Chengkuizengella axinellae TaxID=3064388 RepID=A0ABT9J3H4_9BACL|nr:metal-dependent hydrolase [Chengkuizengella sp. 2205SS18-9]MDP5276140.1 metal-dependent hydrolase [Chengkuizengella sp. 2205SS18-9]
MTGPTHLLVSTTSAIYLGYSSVTELLVVGIASLICDIDRKNSLLGRLIPVLPSFIEGLLGKRTLTHSIPFLLLLAMVVQTINSNWIPLLLIGFISHVILDLFTGSVALLYPYSKKFSIRLLVPPVFIETAVLIGLGVFYAFNWLDLYSRIQL